MSGPNDGTLPRVIWMYWEQGLDNAPEVVKKCFESWHEQNPGWNVVMLDKASASEYVDLGSLIGANYGRLTVQKRSNLLRLNLLARYGGVWADATCFCNQPLDGWIHDYMKSGFFVFRDPGRGRIMSSWFMAALPGNHLVSSFGHQHNEYWRTNSFPDQKTKFRKFLVRLFRVMIGKHTDRQDYWLSFLARRILRIHPYFIIHYHFAYHVRRDKQSKMIWDHIPYFNAGPAKILRKRLLGVEMSSKVQNASAEAISPMSKLTWKKSLHIPDEASR